MVVFVCVSRARAGRGYSMVDLAVFLGAIPDWKRYYTVDEIHEKSAEVAEERAHGFGCLGIFRSSIVTRILQRSQVWSNHAKFC
jgi:hypothetical protein